MEAFRCYVVRILLEHVPYVGCTKANDVILIVYVDAAEELGPHLNSGLVPTSAKRHNQDEKALQTNRDEALLYQTLLCHQSYFLRQRRYTIPQLGIALLILAAPHVGHLYTLVLTDILKRWQILRGRKAILCTGTDEHGMKVQQAARKAGQDVRVFCDNNYRSFETLAKQAEIDYDHFIRTSEPGHRFAVQHFWLMLQEKGFIYASKHEGWYSVSDEAFYPPSAVHLTLDPATGRKFMAAMETGKEVEWTSENNYHFRLSALRDRLLDFYEQNPKFIVPTSRMKDVVQQVTAGLEDLSVSRPVERLSWGIPVPDDTSQTIYVWLDALINYLTKAGYPSAGTWPADCHVIGKDIIRFHCIYWPAFLMALDLPLPRQVLTHAHWTIGRAKMSKSTGNVVNPFFALDRFDADTMRYYLAHDGGIQDDSSYDNSYIIERYKKGLQGSLGNLVSRVVRGKGWNVRRAVEHHETNHDPLATEHVARLTALPDEVTARMDDLNPGLAIRTVMDSVYKTNEYMQKNAPWDLSDNLRDVGHLDRIIFLCAESIRITGILLQPVMPSRMKMLLDLIG
ncbi:MAG: hypothetical protein Q9214_000011, partial [Letrouitia sp. 1 TL-2023]